METTGPAPRAATLPRPRSLAGTLAWLVTACAMAGFYILLFPLQPVNADTANCLLAAQDMVAGNWRLHGWYMASDTYWGLDELSYAAIWSLTRNSFLTLQLVPALQWTVLACLALYLGTRPRVALRAPIIIATILLIPVFGPFTAHLYFQAPFHIPTTCCMLATVLFCARLLQHGGRRSSWAWALAVTAFDAALSDPFYQFILSLPLIIALVRFRQTGGIRILTIYLSCVVAGMALCHINTLTGGFTQPKSNIPALLMIQGLPFSIAKLITLWANILGLTTTGLTGWAWFMAVARLPLLLIMLPPLWFCLSHLRKLSFEDLCFFLIILSTCAAVALTNLFGDYMVARFLLPAWVCSAILAARLGTSDRIKTNYTALLGVSALAVCVLNLTQAPQLSPQFTQGEADYIAALNARGLTQGYSEYWQASDTRVATRDAIHVAAISVTYDGSFTAYDWFTKRNWYNGNAANTRFFVTIPVSEKKFLMRSALFGQPVDQFISHGMTYNDMNDATEDMITYVFPGPMPPMLHVRD